jgi:hypothetical protein
MRLGIVAIALVVAVEPLPSPTSSPRLSPAARAWTVAPVVVDEDLRRVFDGYLSGELDRKQVEALGASALLERYLALGEAMRAWRPAAGSSLEERYWAMREVRRQFGLEGMFVSEDAETEAALARRAGREAPLTEAESATIRPLAAMRVEAALRATGASDEDVRVLRVATFGEAAAARLDAVDRGRSDFQRRLEILRAGGGTIEDLFAPGEIPRVEVLERLRGEPSR